MARIKNVKWLSAFYNAMLRDKMRNIIAINATDLKINLTFDARIKATFTKVEGRAKDRLRIVLGGLTVADILSLPEYFTSRKAIDEVNKPIYITMLALLYHELGHDLFTAMFNCDIQNYKEAKYRGFMHQMFNILEDQVIEYQMEIHYKKNFPYDVNPRKYFNFIIAKMFEERVDEYKDDGTQTGFMNYLLLRLRAGKKMTKTCAIYDKYKEGLTPLIKAVLTEPDGDLRITKTITLCEWIIENIKEFNWEMPEPDDEDIKTGKDGGEAVHKTRKGYGSSASGPSKSHDYGDDESAGGKDEEAKADDDESKDAGGKDTSEDDDGKDEDDEDDESCKDDEDETPEVDMPVDDDLFNEVFNDVIHDGDDHEWAIAKECFTPKSDKVAERIDEIIENNKDGILTISNYLQLLRGRKRPKMCGGFTAGKLNIKRIIKNEASGVLCDDRVFMKKVPQGKMTDAAVIVVNDWSGSMHGSRSEVCTRASVIAAQACEWSDTPCAVYAFSKTADCSSGISYTTILKSFEDPLDKAKPFLGLTSSSLIGNFTEDHYVPTFAGNSEEVNLYYIWQQYKKVKHKTKLLFVMCDGMTTGSSENLKEVVTKMEQEDGIIVIGVGIQCNSVLNVYNHAKAFNSMKDLEDGLAPYLVDTISKYVQG